MSEAHGATVTEEEFVDTGEFLRALEPDGADWVPNDSWLSPWVFRGQRDAAWALVPSAWRPGDAGALGHLAWLRNRFADEALNTGFRDEIEADPKFADASFDWVLEAYAQARAEIAIIAEFVAMADRLGHAVPGMKDYVGPDWGRHVPAQVRGLYPGMSLLPPPSSAAAIAQHHGIPTRLLDWSQSAEVAAFFAASEATEVGDADDGGRIAVWAIRPDLLKTEAYVHAVAAEHGLLGFEEHETPRADSKFLQAQKGMFTSARYGCGHFALYGRWPQLERYALEVEKVAGQRAIRKLTLPRKEVGQLLRRLWLRGVSRAHLMPTYDNVKSALVTKWNLQ